MNLQQYLLFNHIEALVWLGIGAAFLIYSVATRFQNRLAVITALAFLVFGCTDFLECESRAWWRPLWLLGLKALCVLTFLLCYLQYRKSRKQK